MTRPKLHIEPEPVDKGWEVFAFAGMLMLVLMPVFKYSELPDQIPVHFNLSGKPDSYAHRGFIWLLPFIGTVLYIFLTILIKSPHAFNYSTKITAENAESQYRAATRLIRILKAVIIYLFAYINFMIIRISLGGSDDLGNYFVLVILGLSTAPIIWYLWKSGQNQKTDGG